MDEKKRKLLWVGDACCPSGFGLATHQILGTVSQHYDVTVLGINFNGDPHDYPYPIYAAAWGGDWSGSARLPWMCREVKPDVIVIQQDGWNIPNYVHHLRQRLPDGAYRFPEWAKIPIVAIVAVDGQNFNGEWLRGVDLAIFWTQFALDEARKGRYVGPAKVIPLGVNLKTFYPMDKRALRQEHEALNALPEGAFVVGNVNRNQPRKRIDLTIKLFAKWITDNNISDAWLYLHSAPSGDQCVEAMALARYYNVLDRLISVQPPAFYGVSEDLMRKTYNYFDVSVSTTQGEGWGLPAMESMACGVACLLPDSSAYGEWAKSAAVLVPCTTTRIDFPYVNVIGAVVDEDAFVEQLHRLYTDSTWRMQVAGAGERRANEERFRWASIGQEYLKALEVMFSEPEAESHAPAASSKEELLERRIKILAGEVIA